MTAAQIKKALRERGLRAVTEKIPGPGGGVEYLVERVSDDKTIHSGWTLGSVTDALKSAYEAVLRKDLK